MESCDKSTSRDDIFEKSRLSPCRTSCWENKNESGSVRVLIQSRIVRSSYTVRRNACDGTRSDASGVIVEFSRCLMNYTIKPFLS